MSLSASGLPFICQIAPVIDTLAFTVFNRFHRASPPWASAATCSRSFIYLTVNFGEAPTEFTTNSPWPRSLLLRDTTLAPTAIQLQSRREPPFPEVLLHEA